MDKPIKHNLTVTEYTGEKFSCTWEVGQNALPRAYTKDFRDGKTHIRLERQECPRTSLAYAIEEKLNSKSTNTDASFANKDSFARTSKERHGVIGCSPALVFMAKAPRTYSKLASSS